MKNEHIGAISGTLLFSFVSAILLAATNSLFNSTKRIELLLKRFVPAYSSENYAWLTLLLCAIIAGYLIMRVVDAIHLHDWEPARAPKLARKAHAKWQADRNAVIRRILDSPGQAEIKISALPFVEDDGALLRKMLSQESSTALRKAILKLLSNDKELMKSVAMSDNNQKLRLEALEYVDESSLVELLEHKHTPEMEKVLLNRLPRGRNEIIDILRRPLSDACKTLLIGQIEDMETLADLKEILKEPPLAKALDARIVELRGRYIDGLWNTAIKKEVTTEKIRKLIEGERLLAVRKGIIARVSSRDVLQELSGSDIDPILKKAVEDRLVKLDEEDRKAEERRQAQQEAKRKKAEEEAREAKATAERKAAGTTPGVIVFSGGYNRMSDADAVTAIMMFALKSGNPHLMMDSIPKFSLPLFGELGGEEIVRAAYKRSIEREGWRPITPQIQFAFKEGVPQFAIAFPALADVIVSEPASSQDDRFANADADTVKDLLANLGENAKKRGVTGVWSWTDSRSGTVRYAVFYSTAESNEFEFNAPDYVTDKVQFWERGSFSSAGRVFVDGPDWADQDQKRIEAERGGELEMQLFEAIEANDEEAVKSLLARGASANAKGGTWNNPALLEAGQGNKRSIVEALLAAGANASSTTSAGWPVLAELISRKCDIAIIKALVEAGSDVNMLTPTGVTPLSIAEARSSDDVAALLRAHGAR